MHPSVQQLLDRYTPNSSAQAVQALREIIQEISLVGLWRAKFFDKAAFYGGTALRILYSLDRFSEDLDFSLLSADMNFNLSPYNQAIASELSALGFDVKVETKIKSIDSQIESAFIKANTTQELIHIGLGGFTLSGIPKDAKIKIKLEIDTNPPDGFKTQLQFLDEPLPVPLRVYEPPFLFAGKMHALLCRAWKNRIKGRDWYDFIWFVRKRIPLNLKHLEHRMIQSKHLAPDEKLSSQLFRQKLKDKINTLDIGSALSDISPYIQDSQILELWSTEFFHSFADKIIIDQEDPFDSK